MDKQPDTTDKQIRHTCFRQICWWHERIQRLQTQGHYVWK